MLYWIKCLVLKIKFFSARRKRLAAYKKIKDYIPEDTFDPTLETDYELLSVMTPAERNDYHFNLMRRRELARRNKGYFP